MYSGTLTHSLTGRCPTPTCCTTRWSSTARRRAVPISPLIDFHESYYTYGSYVSYGSYGSYYPYPLIRVVGIRFDPLLFAVLCWGPTSKYRHPPWGFSPRIRCVATVSSLLPAVLRSPIPHRATYNMQSATCDNGVHCATVLRIEGLGRTLVPTQRASLLTPACTSVPGSGSPFHIGSRTGLAPHNLRRDCRAGSKPLGRIIDDDGKGGSICAGSCAIS